MKLDDLPTPCLVLDRAILQRNIATMAASLSATGAAPAHEDRQSIDVARLAIASQPGGIPSRRWQPSISPATASATSSTPSASHRRSSTRSRS
jgi:hypothetical protein